MEVTNRATEEILAGINANMLQNGFHNQEKETNEGISLEVSQIVGFILCGLVKEGANSMYGFEIHRQNGGNTVVRFHS